MPAHCAYVNYPEDPSLYGLGGVTMLVVVLSSVSRSRELSLDIGNLGIINFRDQGRNFLKVLNIGNFQAPPG